MACTNPLCAQLLVKAESRGMPLVKTPMSACQLNSGASTACEEFGWDLHLIETCRKWKLTTVVWPHTALDPLPSFGQQVLTCRGRVSARCQCAEQSNATPGFGLSSNQHGRGRQPGYPLYCGKRLCWTLQQTCWAAWAAAVARFGAPFSPVLKLIQCGSNCAHLLVRQVSGRLRQFQFPPYLKWATHPIAATSSASSHWCPTGGSNFDG